MKIVQNCNPETSVSSRLFKDIPEGTVFVYGSHEEGPYLRVGSGIVNLKKNYYFAYVPKTAFDNFKELPNARLVIE